MQRRFSIEREIELTQEYLNNLATLQDIATRENCDLSTVHKIVKRHASPDAIQQARGRNVSAAKTGIPRPAHVREALRQANLGKQIARVCPICQTEFTVTPGKIAEDRGKYCSKACYWQSLRISAPKPSPKWKKNTRQTPVECRVCGKAFTVAVSRHKHNPVKYCSRMCQAKAFEQYRGPLSPSWRGGKTSQAKLIRASAEYARWRMAVFQRDKFTCQHCHTKPTYVEAHHVKPFHSHPQLRFDVANGITLCLPCHGEIDTNRKRLVPRK